MLNRWSIWGFIITRIAKAQGFMDPRVLFSQIQRFSRPSEVWVPAELLRSGMVLQARGLLNSQAIQNNLDWVWPFWVRRQFDPMDKAFIPRAFNLTHINLTHRNWTGVGLPDCSEYALVDPRGLVTPIFDGWSIDAWIVQENGWALIPAWEQNVDQQLKINGNLHVVTEAGREGVVLRGRVEAVNKSRVPACHIRYEVKSNRPAWLMICVRPYNPEGICLINGIKRLPHEAGWMVDDKHAVRLSDHPWHYVFASHQTGDLPRDPLILAARKVSYEDKEIHCPVGMATAAAVYELTPGQERCIDVSIPMTKSAMNEGSVAVWNEHLGTAAKLNIPDPWMQELYDIALTTLVLYAPGDVYPGPYTYKRFWFRDAAFIIYVMAAAGLTRNLPKIIRAFPQRQTPLGYFESQDGEWDSNGQAIWAIERFCTLTGHTVGAEVLASVNRAVGWIKRKRMPKHEQSGHAGLLPAGFSAEHLGPTDFYYWDDFWALAGLRAASTVLSSADSRMAEAAQNEGDDLEETIQSSLDRIAEHLEFKGIPASPYRRMDAGAVGSLIVSYPLQLCGPKDERVLKTVEFLIERYLLDGAYYHELSHSGINIYLTLQLAQTLLRAGDRRYFQMVERVAALASPTGQWPEAIHPGTAGGCMGDGQHVWAAAEWVMMIRNMFVREEEAKSTLILCSGIPEVWFERGQDMSFGPTNTIWGPVSVRIEVGETIRVSWTASWRLSIPKIEVRLPGPGMQKVARDGETMAEFRRHSAPE